MIESTIHGNLVVYSSYKQQEDSQMQKNMDSQELYDFLGHLDNNVIVVLGGDGSMLEAINAYYPEEKKFLGINFGNKGFLLHPKDILKIQAPKFEKRHYPLIFCEDSDKSFVAFNELDIKAGNGKMLDLTIQTNQGNSIDILGDGLLISTPAGSTGYNSALRGPILQHDMNSYILHPKAAWKPKGLGPIILSDKNTLHITGKGRVSPCEIYSDGRETSNYLEHINLKVSLLPKEIELYIASTYIDIWDNKILSEQGFSGILREE